MLIKENTDRDMDTYEQDLYKATRLYKVITEEQFRVGNQQTLRELLEVQKEMLEDYTRKTPFLSQKVVTWVLTRTAVFVAALAYQELKRLFPGEYTSQTVTSNKKHPSTFQILIMYINSYLVYTSFPDVNVGELRAMLQNMYVTAVDVVVDYMNVEGNYLYDEND
jgi:hypothetical protein